MDPLLAQGLEITVIGVTVVFVFLVALVGIVRVMSLTVAALGLDAAPALPAPADGRALGIASPKAGPASAIDARTLAVIGEAVRQHRARP